jgi:carboxyl-terminal processing protease
VARSKAFQVIRENMERLKTRREQSRQPLHIKDFWADQKKYKDEANKFKQLQEQMVNLAVQGLPEDMQEIQGIPEKEERIKKWHEQLQSDVYIEEVMRIMDQMKF